MKRLLFSASLVALVTSVAAAPTLTLAASKVAPADEYFGKLKLSILGISNTIKDQGNKIDADPTQQSSVMNSAGLAEDAIHDWEKKYPLDSWIPRTVFSLERLYAKIDSDAARAKAKATMVWLVHDYPKSPQAKIGRSELAANKVGVKPPEAPAAAPTSTP